MKHIITCGFFLLLLIPASGQNPNFGFAATYAQGEIQDIYSMLVDENYYAAAPHVHKKMHSAGGRIWMRVDFSDEVPFFLLSDFSFLSNLLPQDSLAGGHFYLNNQEGYEYRIIFDYDRVSLSLQPGFYFLSKRNAIRPYLAAGPRYNILTGSRILFTSNEPEYNLDIQQALRDGIKFRNDFSLAISPGIDWMILNDNDGKLSISFRYDLEFGTSDILETQRNDFFWREVFSNRTLYQQFSLGFMYQWIR